MDDVFDLAGFYIFQNVTVYMPVTSAVLRSVPNPLLAGENGTVVCDVQGGHPTPTVQVWSLIQCFLLTFQ